MPTKLPLSAPARKTSPEAAFFSRQELNKPDEPRVALFACASDHPNSPKFEGHIGLVKVSLFLRQPADRPPFLSIVGARSGARPNETLGTARVVTSLSGAPRLLMHLSFLDNRRVFVSVSRQLDRDALVALGLDEQRQQVKREAWLATKVEAVHLQDLQDLSETTGSAPVN